MKYEILKEVSEWKSDFPVPNHTYLLGGDNIIAYIKDGDNQVNILKSEMRINKRYRKFISIKNTALSKLIPKDNIIQRDNNVRVFLIKSKEKQYTVELNTDNNRLSCTCTGYGFRGKCKHIEAVKNTL
jgi:hypothetical protein